MQYAHYKVSLYTPPLICNLVKHAVRKYVSDKADNVTTRHVVGIMKGTRRSVYEGLHSQPKPS